MPRLSKSRDMGRVLSGDWDLERISMTQNLKFQACQKHFIAGEPWEATGVYDYMRQRIAERGRFDGCATEEDILVRYERLDTLWAHTVATGKLPAASVHSDPIVFHVDRDGQPFFGSLGIHRIAIAQLAELSSIKVMVGFVHENAIHNGSYRRLIREAGAASR